MATYTPDEMNRQLKHLIESQNKRSIIIWGPPGIGKSTVVANLAKERGLNFTDVRISQLAPTDLRGVPVPNMQTKISEFYPPDFLPKSGTGILFLDEINMAPPVVMGIAQQLVLDRRVGSYVVPDGWFIWAAGNRKQDSTAVFEMTPPMANRFMHYVMMPDVDSFIAYGLSRGFSPRILAFIKFRPTLLHPILASGGASAGTTNKMEASYDLRYAWPSPRSWEAANDLLMSGKGSRVSIAPAVGDSAAGQFDEFLKVEDKLPDFGPIFARKSGLAPFPTNEPSLQFAIVFGLLSAAISRDAAAPKATEDARVVSNLIAGYEWMMASKATEWLQIYVVNLLPMALASGVQGLFGKALSENPELAKRTKAAVAQQLGGLK